MLARCMESLQLAALHVELVGVLGCTWLRDVSTQL